jgi:glycosyltransferase involved in cell wall biosynthesis
MTSVNSTEQAVAVATISGVRILHVTTVAKTLNFLQGQVAFMRRRGFSLHSAGGEARGIPKGWPLPFSVVEMPRRITPLRDLVSIYRLVRIIRRIDPTIVQGHTPKGGLLAMIAATIACTPIRIFQVHGLPHVAARGFRRKLLILATRVSCWLADEVFCVSDSMKNILRDEMLCPPGKACVLGNGSSGGIDTKTFVPPESRPKSDRRKALGVPETAVLAVFVGRIVRDKGVTELVQGWSELRARFSDLHLVIAGETEDQDPIPDHTRKILANDPRIHLIGVCRDMPGLYSACDFIVLPTYREGFPNVLLEAAAMGLPSVATRVPGCTDAVIDGVTGTLVPARDSKALSSAMAKYVMDPDLRRRHGAAGRTRVVRDFQPETIYHDLYRRYLNLLHSPPNTRTRKRCLVTFL